MIDRYSLREMSSLWTLESRFSYMLQVERAVAETQGEMGLIPKSAAQAIARKSGFSLKGVLRREKTTHHDVAAFVDEAASRLGEHGGWLHYGLTSSDVLDTALALQIKDAGAVLKSPFQDLKKTLKEIIKAHAGSICCGRTHGQSAEPSSFGLKILGHLSELNRAEAGLKAALSQCLVGKMSGAVGAYSFLSPQLEQKICRRLGLQPETAATQVIPRDRLARLIFSLSLLGAFLERLALELRHLQRTEVGEVFEMFSKGQTGSSAMPHKKNPISAENLTGIARLLRSYTAPAMENISLWHERDISHSSVERVIIPDAFILAHYGLARMTKLLKNLKIDRARMESNLKSSGGLALSSHVLNALVGKGLPRARAYPLIQKLSHSLKPGGSFQEKLEKDPQAAKYLTKADLEKIFSLEARRAAIVRHIRKTLKKF